MSRKLIAWSVGIGIALVVMGVFGSYVLQRHSQTDTDPKRTAFPAREHVRARIGTQTYSLEVANTQARRIKGLSGRVHIPAQTGMVFYGLDPDQLGMWMKDMLIDIDIVWVDGTDKVTYIASNVSRHSYPKVFQNPPDSPATYVMELGADEASKAGIVPGTRVEFLE